jgi:hypothetical protein
VLTTLYLGPVGAAFYILADKELRPGEHERFVAPMWKQALGSTLHCVSGDAAGVIIAATVTGLLGLPMWFDLTAEWERAHERRGERRDALGLIPGNVESLPRYAPALPPPPPGSMKRWPGPKTCSAVGAASGVAATCTGPSSSASTATR